MKTIHIISAAVALSLGMGSVAFAQGGGPGNAPPDGTRFDRQQQHSGGDSRGNDNNRVQRGGNRNDNRYDNRNDYRPGPAAWAQGRGAGPDHNYYRGGRIPQQYRDRTYVVNDWRGHRLSAPPRGHQWVQSGADYLLIAAATGIIAQIVLGQ